MLSFTPDIREGKGACKGQRGAGECTKDPAGWRAGVGGLATQGERQARELQPQGGMCKLPLPLRYWDPPNPPSIHTPRMELGGGGVGAASRVKVFRAKERTLKTGKPAEQSGQGVSRG